MINSTVSVLRKEEFEYIVRTLIAFSLFIFSTVSLADKYLGNLSVNPHPSNSVANPHGAGNPYRSDSIKNPHGPYGSTYSNRSVANPYATDAPKLYDKDGNYRGKLSKNPNDPDSISNPYGRYGSSYSQDSINNPYGAGNPHHSDSPFNPHGKGWSIMGSE